MLPKINDNFNSIILGLTIYILIFLRINYFDYSLVQDEINFLHFSKSESWFATPPREYFGQMFWVILKMLDLISFEVFFAPLSKVFFSALVFASLLLSLRFSEEKNKQNYVIFLALTSPFFYWSGKVIGPEVLSTFLIFLSLALYGSKKKYLSLVIVGAAAGIKLSAFPAILFIIFIIILSEKKFIRNSIESFALCGTGFIMMNPTDLFGVFARLVERAKTNNINRELQENLIENFFIDIFNISEKIIFTWDLIPNTSFQDLSFSIIVILIITITLLMERSKYLISYVSFLIFQTSWVLIGNSGMGFPWYWTSIIPVTLFVFSKLNLTQQLTSGGKLISPINIGVAIIGVSFITTIPIIVTSIYQKDRQKNINLNYARDMICVEKNFGSEGLPVVKRVDFRFSMDRYDYNIPLYQNGYLFVISDRFFQSNDDIIFGVLKRPNKYLGRCGNLLTFRLE